MVNLTLSPESVAKTQTSIVISGTARSGTTIVGKLVHSFEGVEYTFEPPTLFSLFASIEIIPASTWKLLYSTYLYEDFAINAIAGRAINTNIEDDSSIHKVKSRDEIDARLKASVSRIEAKSRLSRGGTIAYKIPDIVKYIAKLRELFYATKAVIVFRGLEANIASLLNTGWYSDDGLRRGSIWPNYRLAEVELPIPFWVDEEYASLFGSLDELNRCLFLYFVNLEATSSLSDKIIVKYEELVDRPRETTETIAAKLGLRFGEITEEVIGTIKKRKAKEIRCSDGLLSGELLNRFGYASTNLHELSSEILSHNLS
jgi:hypothetical protein